MLQMTFNRFPHLISNEQLSILQNMNILLEPKGKNIEDLYNIAESQSIDYGVLEKAKEVYVLPANIEWNDVGSWDSVELSSLENENILQIDSNNILPKVINSSLQ